MEPLYFVMAIMGCGDAGVQCRQERVEPVRFPTAAACQAAMTSVLQRNADLAYPVVQASCERRGMTLVETGRPRGRG